MDVLKSLSRAASSILTPNQSALVLQARAHVALYADMADMVRLGAYKRGTDPATDEAIRVHPRLNALLTQARNDPTTLDEFFTRLAQALAPDRNQDRS